MSIYWIPVLAIGGGIAMIIVMVSMGARVKERRAQLRADVQMKLIDRFGSASEFVQFVKSPEGKEFLGDAPRMARANYIGGIRNGIILGCIGLGFLFIAILQHDDGWYIPSFILLGLGIGFFVSSFLSMKLARQMESGQQSQQIIE